MYLMTTPKAYLDGLAMQGLVDTGRAQAVLRSVDMPRGTFMTAAERFLCDAMVSMHVEFGKRHDPDGLVDRTSLRLLVPCPDPAEITDGRQPEYGYAWHPQDAMRQASRTWDSHGVPVPVTVPDRMYSAHGGTVLTDSIWSAAVYAAAKYKHMLVARLVEDRRFDDPRVRSMLARARSCMAPPFGKLWPENAGRDVLRRIPVDGTVDLDTVTEATAAYRDAKEDAGLTPGKG